MLSGLFPSLLLANTIFRLKLFFGTYRWVAVGFAITWALRIPGYEKMGSNLYP